MNTEPENEINNPKGALDGLRIVDLSMWWAGPRATRLLAENGAEVIKIEAPCYPDPWRGAAVARALRQGLFPDIEEDQLVNMSPGFNLENTNKLGITLDLSKEKGRDVLMRLVEISDVLVENYSPRVMQNFGLTYPRLKAVNPKLVMISMPAFGLDGPEQDYVAFGATLEGMMGITAITGYEGEGPMGFCHTAYSDPIGGVSAAFAIMAALRHRRHTGEGMHVEMAQLESSIPFVGPSIMDYTLNGRISGCTGNRHAWKAPHGCYRCLGDDDYVSLSVGRDAEWQALCRTMDRTDLAYDARYADEQSRWEHQAQLDPIIEDWTGRHTSYDVMKQLQAVGIAAGPVLNAEEIVKEPHLKARGFFQEVDHAVAGVRPYTIAHPRLSDTPVGIRKPAPCFAQHNDYVFKDILGMSEQEIDKLKAESIISDKVLENEA